MVVSIQTNPIALALASVIPGPAVNFQNLHMIPLLSRDPGGARPEAGYTVLDDGLASGLVEVTEVSEGGSVPELRVVNRGLEPLLIVDGEELVGAKQNRVVNLTIMVAAQSELTIPVSCVEVGRWRARSRGFASAPRAQYASGRAKRMSQVSASMSSYGGRASDQSEVWADIASKSSRLHATSPTGAMEAIFLQHSTFIDSCVHACRPVQGQVGALFVVAGRIVGFDLFDSGKTLRKLLPKLVRSVAVEALDAQSDGAAAPEEPSPHGSTPEHFLGAVGASTFGSARAVGLGEDFRLAQPGLTAAALVAEGRAVHLAAFALASSKSD